MSGGGGTLSVERTKRGKATRKKKKRVGFALDMTPLVDITFLLLTFFMFTTTMAQPQVMEMSLPPEITDEIEVIDNQLLTILVAPDSKLYWYIGNEPPQLAEMKDLSKIAVRENLNKKNRLITALKVSDEAPFGIAVNVLDELNLAEIGITQEIGKEKGPDGKPMKRERRFTIAPFKEDDIKKIQEGAI